MKKALLNVSFFSVFSCLFFITAAHAQQKTSLDSATLMADSIMQQHPQAWTMREFKQLTGPEWGYPYSLVLYGFQKLYLKTGDEKYLAYGKAFVDQLIDKNGKIHGYNPADFNIDSINPGKLLFLLHEKYKDERYLVAMKSLREQLQWQPRTTEGGFWHKNIYPWQMWLDGLYMGAPYYAQFAQEHKEAKTSFDDIAQQFLLIESKTLDKKTGLLYHAWDESHLQRWANKETGLSPHFWSRSMGWYAMALVDTLDYFPQHHPQRKELIRLLNQLAEALLKVQDESKLWYQVTDQGKRYGNYLESSGSAMFAYAFAKGYNKKYLPEKYKAIAADIFNSLVSRHTEIDELGRLHLLNTCGSAGLGNEPYRTGTFEYYVSEAIRTDDPHGVGPFILAGVEISEFK
ncbi:MAG TPA: glycoside hydrolase family 88 protein [Cellvibrio sp.]|nr:glycoside hydrolase family 88 protein [Cellvibrio sp.]